MDSGHALTKWFKFFAGPSENLLNVIQFFSNVLKSLLDLFGTVIARLIRRGGSYEKKRAKEKNNDNCIWVIPPFWHRDDVEHGGPGAISRLAA